MKSNKLALTALSFLTSVAVFSVSGGSVSAAGRNESVIHSFQGGSDSGAPYAALTVDRLGNLYGTTYGIPPGAGDVFELSPPAKSGGAWKEKILYTFGTNSTTDGFAPLDSVIFDAAGNLYGTTKFGGTGGSNCQFGASGCGTVFELSPPSAGKTTWTETILYNFQNSTDGELPQGGLVMDATGNLYGTTPLGGNEACACGTVFELSPPASPGAAWKQTTLYRFNGYLNGRDGQGPMATMTFDAQGNLWGTAAGGGTLDSGTVFRLARTQSGKWAYKTIYNLDPNNSGIGPNAITYYKGNFFGTTYTGSDNGAGGGAVFELSPSADGWTETTLFVFKFGPEQSNPLGGVIVDTKGNLYGTTSGFEDPGEFGTVFKLAPPAVEGGAWTETNLYTFQPPPDGNQPRSGLAFGEFGALYGTTLYGGTGNVGSSTDGTVFAVLP